MQIAGVCVCVCVRVMALKIIILFLIRINSTKEDTNIFTHVIFFSATVLNLFARGLKFVHSLFYQITLYLRPIF